MRLALREAEAASKTGDVPIGAVVVGADGAVIGTGRNQRERDADPTAHAELLALRAAARALGVWRLGGATLYATLEPCAMCAGALVLGRVKRLVYGADDPKTGAAGSVFNITRNRKLNHRLQAAKGVLKKECAGLLKEFFRKKRRRNKN